MINVANYIHDKDRLRDIFSLSMKKSFILVINVAINLQAYKIKHIQSLHEKIKLLYSLCVYEAANAL